MGNPGDINRREALKRFVGIALGAFSETSGLSSIATPIAPAAEPVSAARTIIDRLVRRSDITNATEDIFVQGRLLDLVLADIPNKEFAITGDGLLYYMSHSGDGGEAMQRATRAYETLRHLKPSVEEVRDALASFNMRFDMKLMPEDIDTMAKEYTRRATLSRDEASTEAQQRLEDSYQPPAKGKPLGTGVWTQRPGLVEPLDRDALRRDHDEFSGRGGYSR